MTSRKKHQRLTYVSFRLLPSSRIEVEVPSALPAAAPTPFVFGPHKGDVPSKLNPRHGDTIKLCERKP